MSAYITQRLKAALTHMRQGRPAEAEEILTLVLKAQPDHAEANSMMASLQLSKGQAQKAVQYAQFAVRTDPSSIPARQTLVGVLTAAGERQAALAHIRRLEELNAGTAELAATHAGTLRDLLRYEDALKVYRDALAKYPGAPVLVTMLPFSMNYTPGVSPEEVFAAHVEFGKMIDRGHPPASHRFQNDRDPDRTLRVGFLSADLHGHSVSYYLEPIMQHADPARLRMYLYQTMAPYSDATTARFRQLATAFRPVTGQPPGQVAAAILADQIDVLFDLNGLTSTTAGLPIMNAAPAPVTVTYIGYPHSTGVRSIQYRFVDSITDPPGSERFAVEELVRLDPCFLCYGPPREAPPVNPQPPSARSGRVTFGSFNNIQKLNDGVIGAWARIVEAVPGSRLLMKHFRMREPSLRAELLERFARAGLHRQRLEFLPKVEHLADHLRLYEQLDVALDPFPYNGTTTTCEALHQGVPTVTLRGDRHASRVGASLLTTAGAPELITGSLDEYHRTAVDLARDPARLAAYRATLRQKLLGSPLCDGPGFAVRFEAAVRELWRRWCRRGAE